MVVLGRERWVTNVFGYWVVEAQVKVSLRLVDGWGSPLVVYAGRAWVGCETVKYKRLIPVVGV